MGTKFATSLKHFICIKFVGNLKESNIACTLCFILIGVLMSNVLLIILEKKVNLKKESSFKSPKQVLIKFAKLIKKLIIGP